MSLKVKMLSTGEVREVTRNVAFDLIDRKLAVLDSGQPPVQKSWRELRRERFYANRQMRTR